MCLETKQIKVEGNFPVSVLRSQQNEILKNHVSTLSDLNKVLSVGALQSDVDKEGKRYRDYFPNSEFYTLDKYRIDSHRNHLCMDLHDLETLKIDFDLILCMCVLEHVENPFVVSSEIVKCMKPNCYLFVCVPFFYPIHKRKEFSDYWRFTDDSLKVLFKDLKEVWIKEMSSVISAVNDRDVYWDHASTVCGYSGLFIK